MKYRTKTVVEDKHLFDDWTSVDISRLMNFSEAYISKVRSGISIISEKKYLEFKKKLHK
jgi:hypothetical protein